MVVLCICMKNRDTEKPKLWEKAKETFCICFDLSNDAIWPGVILVEFKCTCLSTHQTKQATE